MEPANRRKEERKEAEPAKTKKAHHKKGDKLL
jgi:hypothetical protein